MSEFSWGYRVKGVDPQEIRRETRMQIVVLRGVREDRHFGGGKTCKNHSVGKMPKNVVVMCPGRESMITGRFEMYPGRLMSGEFLTMTGKI